MQVNYFAKFALLGLTVLLAGLAMRSALPKLIGIYINKQLALTPNSQTYPMWKEIPVPVYQKFYFFNVTNAQEIEQRGERPQLEEIGPFTYRSEWSKRDIEHLDQKELIRFKHFKQWYFEPEMSVASERLQLVTLNAPLAITLSLIQSASNAVRLLVTFSLDGLSDGFFTRRSIKQLLFEGYPDLLTTFGPLLNAEMLSQGGHFGYMNARNNSLDGQYEIHSGEDDIGKLNTIASYNGRTRLPFWHNHNANHQRGDCNSLAGATTGELFPPIADNQTHIRLFQPDFCRAWRLDYHSKFEQPQSGLRLKRFVATRDVFRNSTDLPENSCYFRKGHAQNPPSAPASSPSATNRIPNASGEPAASAQTRPSRASRQQQHQQQQQQQQANNAQSRPHRGHSRVRHEWPAGVFTLAPCKFNAPIYVSMPHFLDADASYLSTLDGLAPNKDKHEFYVDVEPRTGSPVSLNVRVQLNVAISKPPGLVRFRNMPEIMFPVFWQEFSVNITEGPVIEQLLLASRVTDEGVYRISATLMILGTTILVIVGLFYLRSLREWAQQDAGARTSQPEPPKAGRPAPVAPGGVGLAPDELAAKMSNQQ